MKIFKQVNLPGKYTNNSDKYQLLIHFYSPGTYLQLLDENGIVIEQYNQIILNFLEIQYPQITGQENLSTGAISYNAFNSKIQSTDLYSKSSMQKILIPPGFSLNGIQAGLFIELDNLEELKGLI